MYSRYSAASSTYICVISICAALEQTAEEKCIAEEILASLHLNWFLIWAKVLNFNQSVFWTKSTHFCLFLRECLLLDLCHFILTAVKTGDINLFYDALLKPHSSFTFLCVKKQHRHFAKLLDSCVWNKMRVSKGQKQWQRTGTPRLHHILPQIERKQLLDTNI